MKKYKNKMILGIVIFFVLIVLIFILMLEQKEEIQNIDLSTKLEDSDLETSWNEEVSTTITLKQDDIQIKGDGVLINQNTITIKSPGTYYITGILSDGNIIVNTSNSAQVHLVLSNVDITCKTTAPIYIENADKTIITLEADTTNKITDGNKYIYTSTGEEEPDGALFSKDDLTINGEGSLEVIANYLDGIVSKDELKIIGTNIKIIAQDDALRGKDSLIIQNSNISIDSSADGIKSTNTTDTTLGYIVIENSTLYIQAGQDGIQAETQVQITNSNLTIKTGGGSSNSSTSNANWGNWQTTNNQTEDTTSAKGIKGNTAVQIISGMLIIDSSDDGIHSNGNIIIENGTIQIASGDDGIHADNKITINGGTIDITKSYEGIEAAVIEINNGKINVVASDDGINVAGGNDNSSMEGRPGQNTFSSANKDYTLTINGGELYVNATGDGIDINGYGYMNGGTVYIDGPTSSGNGAMDYDGEFKVTGGIFVAVGSSGMHQGVSTSSTQYAINLGLSQNYSAGSVIVIKDSSGKEIMNYKSGKSFGAAAISLPDLKQGSKYSIYINDNLVSEFTISSIVTSIGNTTGGNIMQTNPGRGIR